MTDFIFNTTQSIISAPGALSQLGEQCRIRQLSRVLIVSDPTITQLGLLNKALESLQAAAISWVIYDQVIADPPEHIVTEALALAQSSCVEAVIGFGGGSSMDVAKVVALLYSGQQTLAEIYGVGNATACRLPLIQIPTTSGTGSEVTPVAIITTGETTKQGIVATSLLPDLALLDAELTLGLPAPITAATGIDAMVHAIEAYTSKIKKNPYSDMLAKEALCIMHQHIATAVHQGDDIDSRTQMLYGATLAGQAFANAPVGAVHALAYPLGGRFHIPHGLSNSLVLPAVLRFNLAHARKEYAELATAMVPDIASQPEAERALQLIELMQNLIAQVELPTRLGELNIPQDSLATLAEDSMLQQRLLMNNPRELGYEDALSIYQSIY